MAVTKTFVPHYLFLIKKLALYYTKHRGKMAVYLSGSQLACVDSIATAVNTCLGSITEANPEP